MIPNYVVYFTIPMTSEKPGDPYEPARNVRWNVPETDLDALCKILRWNGVKEYSITWEEQ